MSLAKRLGASWSNRLRSVTTAEELPRLMFLMGLFFLIVCSVGILRPIKNSLALDGLGATDFYKVYLVSAVVVLFVPAFNRLARLLPWQTLFGAVALFFALNLVAFRFAYREGSATYGLMFYGWYDLFAAALVTQFFMATQFYFNARSARTAYPLVIAGGSIGAALGGAITGLLAESVGTPNLLLVAAALITVFAVCIPIALRDGPDGREAREERKAPNTGLRELLADRHVRLIAGTVLLTILVKQLVDYQFNAISKDVFVTLDSVAAFQGKFNAATQWLPLVVLAGLRPALRRWGMGVAVLLLPAFMLLGTAALAVTFGLAAAVLAKGAETSLRYSAERAGREILYVPLPETLKLDAKAWIDVAVEKGVGKVASALLIMALLQFMGYRQLAWVSLALCVVWVGLAVALQREYVRTLGRSIDSRFASLRGAFTTTLDANTLPAIRGALADSSPLRIRFGLELLEPLEPSELRRFAPELNALLHHPEPHIVSAALELLALIPDTLDEPAARSALDHEDATSRHAAVRALLMHAGAAAPVLLNRLLRDEREHVRTAALNCVLAPDVDGEWRTIGRDWVRERLADGTAGVGTRAELALAAGALHDDEDAHRILVPCLRDEDPRVRSSALRSAGLLGRADMCGQMIAGLRDAATRDAAREALLTLGPAAIQPLADALLDPATAPRIRLEVPRTLARIPAQPTVDVLLRLVLAPETDQLLDFRTLKALSKLRAKHPELRFDPALVLQVADRECRAAAAYAGALRSLDDGRSDGPPARQLLRTALRDGFEERREGVFRCLALLHPHARVRQAHAAVTSGNGRGANALEWLEQTIGGPAFRQLSPVLEPGATAPVHPTTLADDGDEWIACLARACTSPRPDDMELIEKVLLLQQVDLLRGLRSAHVALLASIAEEIDAQPGRVLIRAGERPSAMYVVVRGSVELTGLGAPLTVEADGAFGTWALIDDQPSVVEARVVERALLLEVSRDDFHDLLADHSEVAIGLLQGLARRMRTLVA